MGRQGLGGACIAQVYNGQIEAVMLLLTCCVSLYSLDFLGDSAQLLKWYGSSYPFSGNPFAFAFPLSDLWPCIATDKQVQPRYQPLSGCLNCLQVENFSNQAVNNCRRSCQHLIASRPAEVSFGDSDGGDDVAQARKEDRIHRDAVIATQTKLNDLASDV